MLITRTSASSKASNPSNSWQSGESRSLLLAIAKDVLTPSGSNSILANRGIDSSVPYSCSPIKNKTCLPESDAADWPYETAKPASKNNRTNERRKRGYFNISSYSRPIPNNQNLNGLGQPKGTGRPTSGNSSSFFFKFNPIVNNDRSEIGRYHQESQTHWPVGTPIFRAAKTSAALLKPLNLINF